MKEVKEALDAGLISQAEYDAVKSDYVRAKKECQKLELRAKNEAFLAKKEAFEFQRKELRAKEEFQKKELRAKEEALEFQKRELIVKEAFQQRKSESDLRAYALESIVKHGSSIMSEEQKADLVRDYARMSGLDGGAERDERALKRQRPLSEERDAPPSQPPTPPAAVPPPADAPVPVDEDEYSNYSDGDDGEDASDSDEPRTAKRTKSKKWTEEDDAALVAALRAGQTVTTIKIRGRSGPSAKERLKYARKSGLGSPALREYLEETCPEYVYKGPSKNLSWSAEEDLTFIQAHREGKTWKEIAAILPRRSYSSVSARWSEAKIGRKGSAALKAYAAECCKAAAS